MVPVFITKPKANYRFCVAAMLLFYVLQNEFLNERCIISEALQPNKISVPYTAVTPRL